MINKDRQVKEIVRCGKDPAYFINKYVRIQHPKKGLVPFDTYEFQDRCIDDFQNHRFNVVLKARQMGMSTLTAAYAAHMALFYKDKNILIIATKLDVAKNIIKKVKTIIKNLPKWLVLPQIVTENKQTLEFSNRSTLKATPTSEDAGRSEALSLLIVDEAAFIRGFDELWMGLLPTITTGGKVIIISTPNGASGQYYQIYADAEAGVNEFNPIKITWDLHPDHDQQWLDNLAKNMSPKQLAQEYLCDFVTSGDTFLSADDIAWLSEIVRDPIKRVGPEGNLWVWEDPLPNHKYVISADVSRGDATDYSTCHVIDIGTDTAVAEFKGKIPPDNFGEFLNMLGKQYNDALVCPENNSFGYSTIVKLKDLGYPNLFHPSRRNAYGFVSAVKLDDQKYGFQTNAKTRMEALVKLESVLRNKQIKIYSSRFINEMKTFVWNAGKAQAQKGRHDDLVMSLAIGLYLFEQGGSNHDEEMKVRNAMLLAMSKGGGEAFNTVKNTGKSVTERARGFMPQPGGDYGSHKTADDDEMQKHFFNWLFK